MKYDNLHIDQTEVAFCHSGDFAQGAFDWHTHRWSHLLYAVRGMMRVEVADSLWLLPPQRAIWVSADVPHRTDCLTPTHFHSIFFAPNQIVKPMPIRVFDVTPLAREMIRFASRWQERRDPDDPVANHFFEMLLLLCKEWMAEGLTALRLPRPQSDAMGQVVDYILGGVDAADLNTAADLIAVSPRTLRRQMQREMQTTWRQFLHDARMLRAMELLGTGEQTVTEVAFAVGYQSLSAFTKAFTLFTGERPSQWSTHSES